MDKIANPNLLTYGMIGMTTVILAALTVFDSNTEESTDNTSYVSQLFQREEPQEEGLLSSILQEQDSNSGNSGTSITGGKSKKTRRHKKKHSHKKTKGTRK